MRLIATVTALLALLLVSQRAVSVQGPPALLESLAAPPAKHAITPRRARRVLVNASALQSSVISVTVFEDTTLILTRTSFTNGQWIGRDDAGNQGVFAVTHGILSGAVYADGRTFEVTFNRDGRYEVIELDPASFPDDANDAPAPKAPHSKPSAQPQAALDTTSTIDVMVLWTPAARLAVGGSVDAIQSLTSLAVANTNLSYLNSGVPATLRLVYSAEIGYTEGSISADLPKLASDTTVATLRTQYGADVVTLLGNGYAAGGTCGIGYIMNSLGAWFAPYAFNVVDQSCAGGYLSYAHEVGHNEGLQHDPANAGSNLPAWPFAYGYQDPGGAFRTVMSYGGALRIPYFSSPLTTYNSKVTGTATQDNARALNLDVATVAAFVATVVSPPPPPPPPPTLQIAVVSPLDGTSFPIHQTSTTGFTSVVTSNAVSVKVYFGPHGGSLTSFTCGAPPQQYYPSCTMANGTFTFQIKTGASAGPRDLYFTGATTGQTTVKTPTIHLTVTP